MSLYDLKFWIRGIGLVAIASGTGMAVAEPHGMKPPIDPAIYGMASSARFAISTGLFRKFGIYTALVGVVLVVVSQAKFDAGKK